MLGVVAAQRISKKMGKTLTKRCLYPGKVLRLQDKQWITQRDPLVLQTCGRRHGDQIAEKPSRNGSAGSPPASLCVLRDSRGENGSLFCFNHEERAPGLLICWGAAPSPAGLCRGDSPVPNTNIHLISLLCPFCCFGGFYFVCLPFLKRYCIIILYLILSLNVFFCFSIPSLCSSTLGWMLPGAGAVTARGITFPSHPNRWSPTQTFPKYLPVQLKTCLKFLDN